MTVFYGSITSIENGWKFQGKFGPKGGPPLFAIIGGLNAPIENLCVPHAELVNPKIGSYEYEGEIGPQFLSIRTSTLPQVIVLGKLAESIAPKHVAGWFQIAPVLRE